MNSVLRVATGVKLNDCEVQTDRNSMINTPIAQDSYDTAPMVTVNRALHDSSDEEELHTAFEEAISERTMAMWGRLNRISSPLLYSQQIQPNTDPIITPISQEPIRTFGKVWQRWILFGSLVLLCVLIGFDLMGLLVLHMH